MSRTYEETRAVERARPRVTRDGAPYSSVVPFRSLAGVPVDLPSDLPPDVGREITRVVQVVFDHIVGDWRMIVQRRPFERGRWRLELRGPTGTNIWTFLGGDHQLPEMIGRTLNAFIRAATTEYQRQALAQLAS